MREDPEKARLTEDANIITLVQNLMVAGNLNTSSLMASLLNILCHYPRVQDQLQAEVDSVVGDEREVRMAHEKYMVYTQAVVLELLRSVQHIQHFFTLYELWNIFYTRTIDKACKY